MSSSRALLIAGVLSLVGCVAETGELASEAPGAEEVGEAAQDLSMSAVATYSAAAGNALLETNGRKMVVAGGRVHAVWAVGGVIKYSSSADGATWDAPVDVDASASRTPTIAAASDGRIGIAYVKNYTTTSGEIYYRSLIGYPAVWTAPVRVVSNYQGVGNTPSMAAGGTTMYLAWANGWIYHAAFNANLTASLPSGELVTSALLCGSTTASLPSIAVSGSSVRIAQFENLVSDPGCPPVSETHIRVTERGAGSWATWYDLAPSALASHVSLSMDAHAGVFYIAASSGSGAAAATNLHKLYGGWPFPSVATTNLTLNQTYVSVSARRQDCQDKVRVQWSRKATYGFTNYRTATWAGAAPSWLEAAPVSLSGAGRTGTAMLQTLNLAGGHTRYFHAFFDDNTGVGAFTLKDAYDTVSTVEPCE